MATRQAVIFYREYVDLLGGDILAAIMLSRIVFWYLPSPGSKKTKLRVSKSGVLWLVKSHVDWHDECGFTKRQTFRCLSVLRAAGIIVTEVHRFNGTPTLHLRLVLANGGSLPFDNEGAPAVPHQVDFEALHGSQILKRKTSDATEEPSTEHTGEMVLDLEVKSLTSTTQGVRQGEPDMDWQAGRLLGEEQRQEQEQIRKEDPIKFVKGFHPNLKFLVPSKTPETPTKDPGEADTDVAQALGVSTGGSMKAQEILTRMQTRAAPEGSLAACWVRTYTTEIGPLVKPLTAKEKGQLSQLKKIFGDRTRALLQYALAHWLRFGSRVQGTGFPPTPNIGYLLKYGQVAYDMLTERHAVRPPLPAETVPVKVRPVAESPAPLLSKEALDRLLASFKE